jgi:hypothetical protein
MAVFIEKLPVTSSNCYETMKNASILMTLGTNIDWTIASVSACSILNFLLPWQQGTSQNCEITLFWALFFHQNRFQSAATSQWIEIVSKAFHRWLHVALRSTWDHFSLSHIKTFLAVRGTTAPFKPPKQNGAHPPSGNTLLYHIDGAVLKKSTFCKRKTCFLGHK